MSGESCPMPSVPGEADSNAIKRMLSGKRIAVVGMSDDPGKPSHYVSKYMREAGYEVIPVNPLHSTVMGLKCYGSLAEVPGRIDVVNVFRRPAFCAGIAEEAVAVKARGIWLQAGIGSVEARRIAEAAGVDYVENHCIMVEHMHGG